MSLPISTQSRSSRSKLRIFKGQSEVWYVVLPRDYESIQPLHIPFGSFEGARKYVYRYLSTRFSTTHA